jgi:hypothetical protein
MRKEYITSIQSMVLLETVTKNTGQPATAKIEVVDNY